jgi:hypothetical protein
MPPFYGRIGIILADPDPQPFPFQPNAKINKTTFPRKFILNFDQYIELFDADEKEKQCKHLTATAVNSSQKCFSF